jgi:hypothetical protein
MSYEDRQIKPAYTSIHGTRTTWKYRDGFSIPFQNRIDSRRYVGLDGTHHVMLGTDGRDYPMVCVFDGVDHDLDAQAFVKTLLETPGPGTAPHGYLEHPVHGVKPVTVDSGREMMDLVSDAAETIVEVLFQLDTLPPEVQVDSPEISTEKQFDALSASASSDFDALSFLDTPNGVLSAVQATTANLNKIQETMSRVAVGNAELITTINQIQDDILRNLDTVVRAPFTLATQMQQMIGTIAAIPDNFAANFNAWADLYSKSRSADDEITLPYNENRNVLSHRELTCTACVANMYKAVAAEASNFTSGLDALNALADITALRQDLEGFLSLQQASFDDNVFQEQYIAQSETLDQMSTLSQLAGDAIRQAAPNLGAEITVVLSKDYNIITLANAYHDDISDATLNKIIDSNLLQLDEIVLLQRGSTVLI